MQLSKTILRDKCIYSGKSDLEYLHSFKNFPIFMGCTSEDPSKDIYTEMRWEISRSTGSVQLNPLVPLEILYANPHNEAVGDLWMSHHLEFCKFISHYNPQSIFEIGGANGLLASQYISQNKDTIWTILDPNPTPLPHEKRIKTIKGFLDTYQKRVDDEYDMVIHTHVFEHAYNPRDFLKSVGQLLKTAGGKMIFAVPNMAEGIKSKFTNMLNFEHSYLLDECNVEKLLAQEGFKVLSKKYFRNHSIFYATEYDPKERLINSNFENNYLTNKNLMLDYINYYKHEINRLNNIIVSKNSDLYLFGAHIFSQFLITNGLNIKNVKYLLDNGPSKNNKRLYGTNLIVKFPEYLKNKNRPRVILKAGAYNDEIKKQILENINDSVEFIE